MSQPNVVPKKHEKPKKKRLIDRLWGPLGLLLIVVVVIAAGAAVTMLFDTWSVVDDF